jgi:hypothetical protein
MENLEARLAEVRQLLEEAGAKSISQASELDIEVGTLPDPPSRFDAIVEMVFGSVVIMLAFSLGTIFILGYLIALHWLFFGFK